MSKHTPAPWVISHYLSCRHPDLEDEFNAFHIGCLSEDRDASEEEARANANLIGAAPELLEALKKIMKHYYAEGGRDFQKARAAIKKAEGK